MSPTILGLQKIKCEKIISKYRKVKMGKLEVGVHKAKL